MRCDFSYCVPMDDKNEICITCERNLSAHVPEGKILTMTNFSPVKSKIHGWHCDGHIDKKVKDV